MSTGRQKITFIRRFFRVPSPPLPPFSGLIHPTKTMPTCRRKRVVLTEPSPALLEALKKDPSRDVFYLERTGELFETYESVLQHVFTLHPTHNVLPGPRNI
jgi:hypothetical protein